MNSMMKGLAVALLHLSIVASVGGKLLYDRAYCPRVWVKTASYDPNLPIRGRYVALRVPVLARGVNSSSYQDVVLSEEKGKLVATGTEESTGVRIWGGTNGDTWLAEPVLFFLPEHVKDPSWLQRGEELWVEVTIPKKGPPRPLQLALKKATQWTPLTSR